MEWYVHASSGVIPILLTAIAHGRTQTMFEAKDW